MSAKSDDLTCSAFLTVEEEVLSSTAGRWGWASTLLDLTRCATNSRSPGCRYSASNGAWARLIHIQIPSATLGTPVCRTRQSAVMFGRP